MEQPSTKDRNPFYCKLRRSSLKAQASNGDACLASGGRFLLRPPRGNYATWHLLGPWSPKGPLQECPKLGLWLGSRRPSCRKLPDEGNLTKVKEAPGIHVHLRRPASALPGIMPASTGTASGSSCVPDEAFKTDGSLKFTFGVLRSPLVIICRLGILCSTTGILRSLLGYRIAASPWLALSCQVPHLGGCLRGVLTQLL